MAKLCRKVINELYLIIICFRLVILRFKLRNYFIILNATRYFSLTSETFVYNLLKHQNSQMVAGKPVAGILICHGRASKKERKIPYVFNLKHAGIDDFQSDRLDKIIGLIFKILPINVVHSHFGWTGVPMSMALRRAGVETHHVISFHGSDINEWPRRFPWYQQALKTSENFPKQHVSITVPAAYLKKKLTSLGVADSLIQVMPNAVQSATLERLRVSESSSKSNMYRVVNVGRLSGVKGQAYLIKAFKKFLLKTGANARLEIIGGGELQASLMDLTRENGIQDVVHFKGERNHSSALTSIASAQMYIQSSIVCPETQREEGQPVAVIEALAMGVPTIVTATGGMPELATAFGEQSGVSIVNSADVDGLARAIILQWSQRDEVEVPYKKYQEHFSLDRQLERFCKIYGDDA